MDSVFYEGLIEANIDKLIAVPKSDIHNHSGKGCRIIWLEAKINRKLSKPDERFNGLEGMQEWFAENIKPYCSGKEGLALRWEGAFAEAKRNNIKRLSMNFDVEVIKLVGGMDIFVKMIEGLHQEYCPETVFEPEITYISVCDVVKEAECIDQYISTGFFKSIDVCGGEDVRPIEDFLPLYRKAEHYHLIKRMHVGETGTADGVKRAVETLGLDEVHHGIHAFESKEVMAYLVKNNIQLNVCPSSNVMLGYAKDYKNHPIKTLYENGVKVTINTDDLLIFDSSIENEYLLLFRSGALSAEQLDDIRLFGLRANGNNIVDID